jgi:hypothetical protein
MNFVLALAMSFSELFTKFAMPIFSERPFCQTTIANSVTNVEKIKRIELNEFIIEMMMEIFALAV